MTEIQEEFNKHTDQDGNHVEIQQTEEEDEAAKR